MMRSPVAPLDLVLISLYRGRPTITMPSSSSVSFSLRRILLPSEVTSECGVTGLSSATSRGCDAVTSAVEGTGVDSFGVGGVTTETSSVVCDKVKTSEGASGVGGAFGSEISRNVSSICWRMRTARSPTSAPVKPSVETGGSTGHSNVNKMVFARVKGRRGTSHFKGARVEDTFMVDVPVVFRYYGDDREASLDGKVKSTLLEGSNVVVWA